MKILVISTACFMLLSLSLFSLAITSSVTVAENPAIEEMLVKISESEIYDTVYDLQSFVTRKYGYSGNTAAGTYLYNRLASIPGLSVEYEGGSLRNVVATLRGADATSNAVYIVGAHYDSTSTDPSHAPGACDDGGGVAIVLEFARIMSQYSFRHTVKFTCWNREEDGHLGSLDYARRADSTDMNVPMYLNFDSSCYDPDSRFVLDIMYNADSAWVSNMMTQHNSLYGIGFALTYNVHTCGSDHRSFWQYGYTAVMTHCQTHGPAHTASDTVDKISTLYAKKNGQLGMSMLATLAEVQASGPLPGDIDGDSQVNINDLVLLAKAFGTTPNDPAWNPDADIDNDGTIGLADLAILAHHYGQHVW